MTSAERAVPAGPLVDSHAHVYRSDLPQLGGSPAGPPADFRIDEYEAILDRHGVAFGVIAAPRFLGTYNDHALHAISGRPRFRATVILDPGSSLYTLKAMAADGAVGVRLSLYDAPHLPDLASHEYRIFFRRLADIGWHIHLHIDAPRLPLVLPMLTAAPMRLVVDHFGRPGADGVESEGFEALLRAFDTGRTLAKLSGGFRLPCDPAPLARALLAAGGPHRLLWGSDCPFVGFGDAISYQTIIDDYEAWLPSPADRAAVDATSRDLYGFD